jgi:hypothetical protein
MPGSPQASWAAPSVPRAGDERRKRRITHNNAETLFVEAAGVEFAYPRPAELSL